MRAVKETRYSIGIDFGTESGRAVLVELGTGREVANCVYKYKDGVIDEFLPDGKIKLEPDWALQNPDDYISTLKNTIPAVLRKGRVKPEQVVGAGIDFTSCTVLPVDKNGRPLCAMKKFKNLPHSWVKLWKHHSAQPEADRINLLASGRNEQFLGRYGGKISSEWFFPKVLEVLNEAPEIYEAADRFIEAADWIVWQVTGVEKRNSCTAGYKAMWGGDNGFPDKNFFKALDPRLENVIDDKMSRDIRPMGECAGVVTKAMARLTGLKPGTPVAVGNVDAHVAVPAAGVTRPGKMVMIMGTSICHMLLGRHLKPIPGICGVVKDGILPGYYGYEAGQSAVGDIFAWYIEHCIPWHYHQEALRKKVSIHTFLSEKAGNLMPGSSGMIALDWWNGNRSVLTDADLFGVMLGFSLNTKPEEIYRTLIEATAFGTYKIIKTLEENSVPVESICACGGLPDKNKLLMQIYADVTGREIRVAASSQTPALGSAMFGAVAAGSKNGGYDSIIEAADKMAKLKPYGFTPNPQAHKIYQELFSEYERLHDYFGRGENEVMKRLKRIKLNSQR